MAAPSSLAFAPQIIPLNQDSPLIIRKIHEVIVDITSKIASGQPPTIELVSRSSASMALVFDDGTYSLEQGAKNKVYKSLRSITSMLLVFKIVLRLLRSEKTATQRELYYMFPNHFKDQSICNEAILQCAGLLGVDRESLNLRASSRGSYSGLLRVWEPGIGVVDGSTCDPMSISSHWITNQNMQCDPSRAQFILVIEKEVEDKFWQRLPCILITGKGFPDLATRAMCHQVSTRFKLPIYGLADCNPFGLSLLMTYKLGSARMGSRFTCDLKWLGLRPSQLSHLNISPDSMQDFTPRDMARMESLKALLSGASSSSNTVFQPYLDELEIMSELQQKCELEALISSSFDLSLVSTLSEFLERAIMQRSYL